MKFAIADNHGRLFNGEYQPNADRFYATTTTDVAQARTYEQRDIADIIARLLNALDTAMSGERFNRWNVVEHVSGPVQ